MSARPRSFREAIKKWPTIADWSRDIGITTNAGKTMYARDAVHSTYWLAMVEAAKQRGIKGVDLDLLAHLSRERGPKVSSKTACSADA
jgi:hypothetical protein